MNQPLDLDQLQAQFEKVRHSEYFPAILGAVAGGLTGAIMAGIIAGGRRTVEVKHETVPESSGIAFGLSARDLVQLGTVVASLARQIRDWREQS